MHTRVCACVHPCKRTHVGLCMSAPCISHCVCLYLCFCIFVSSIISCMCVWVSLWMCFAWCFGVCTSHCMSLCLSVPAYLFVTVISCLWGSLLVYGFCVCVSMSLESFLFLHHPCLSVDGSRPFVFKLEENDGLGPLRHQAAILVMCLRLGLQGRSGQLQPSALFSRVPKTH